jgi:hypothetical protein
VHQCLQRYVLGYTFMLTTIKGPSKDDLGIGHRTFGKSGPKRTLSRMEDVGIVTVLSDEWFDSTLIAMNAFAQGCDVDSDGSMLTRSAIVMLYAMIDAQLSVVSEWKLREKLSAFSETEARFLREAVVDIGRDGEPMTDSDQHPFKKRVKAVPAVLARCLEGKEYALNLGAYWGQDLLLGHALRSNVMHTSQGGKLPTISKQELRRSIQAVREYFSDLASALPAIFGYMNVFLKEDLTLYLPKADQTKSN